MAENKKRDDGFPRGQAVSLARTVDYQTGSIVSRTVIDKQSGTVTLFAFDEGQGLSEHTAPFDALVYLIEGEAQITISGGPRSVHAGEILIMPAHEPHALRAVRQFKMMLIMIRQ